MIQQTPTDCTLASPEDAHWRHAFISHGSQAPMESASFGGGEKKKRLAMLKHGDTAFSTSWNRQLSIYQAQIFINTSISG